VKLPVVLTDRRFVAGMVLVVSALLGLYAFRADASGAPVLAAARDIAAGHVIGPDDLAEVTVKVDGALPRSLVPATARNSVEGQVALRHLPAGQLVQAGDSGPSGPARREVSVPVGPDHVPSGRISAGDRVDVLATYGDGAAVRTVVVARAVEVVGVDATTSLLGGDEGGPLSAVTVATDTRTASLLVFAGRSAKVDVVKALGDSDGGGEVGYDDLGASPGTGR